MPAPLKNTIKLVTFDAYQTLFKPRGSTTTQYVKKDRLACFILILNNSIMTLLDNMIYKIIYRLWKQKMWVSMLGGKT